MAEPKFLTVDHLSTRDITRIFSKIVVNPVTECWEWQAKISHNGKGYGRVWFRGREQPVHRVLYAWAVGPVPLDIKPDIPNLDHLVCEVKHCCNPSHVWLKLPGENVRRSRTALAAINARKTHCPEGHMYQTVQWKQGTKRVCNPCRQAAILRTRQAYTPEEHQRYLEYHRRWKLNKKRMRVSP